MNRHNTFRILLALGALFLTVFLALGASQLWAQEVPAPTVAAAGPLHPRFALLDVTGSNVLETGAAVSPQQTCGQCHDAAFIAGHSFHANPAVAADAAGMHSAPATGTFTGTHAGTKLPAAGASLAAATPLTATAAWDPLTGRYLSAPGAARPDLDLTAWLHLNGARYTGGLLGELAATEAGADVVGADVVGGTLEMNCFLCHLPAPNNAARTATIAAGDFGDAATATLLGTGLVTGTQGNWTWNAAAFDADGLLTAAYVAAADPTNDNCGQCHGTVHTGTDTPLLLDADCTYDPAHAETATTGQVVSGQRIAASGVNLAGKEGLVRAWDVHAERQLQCTDCHYALNNPAHRQETADAPEHLLYDPRRLDIAEYLQRPDHDLARGQSAQYAAAGESKGTMRRCESCHDAAVSHADWLPYTDRHMATLACESCHIPKLYAPSLEQVDWTVLTAAGGARTTCRGVESADSGAAGGGVGGAAASLVTPYEPVLLTRSNSNGTESLTPYNLITTYYWVYDSEREGTLPVRQADLRRAWFEDGAYAPEVLAAFDTDGDGILNEAELRIDSEAKRDLMAARLAALGLRNPRVAGEVRPYSINHGVTRGEWALRDCQSCHAVDSRLAQTITLAAGGPFGVTPALRDNTNVRFSGELDASAPGTLAYRPVPAADNLYVFGHDNVLWIDWLGALLFVGVLLAVGTHAAGRYFLSLRRPRHAAETKRIYMYDAYERFWHWLQTSAILLLLFTGLIIHKPHLFGMFAFPHVVTVHNVLAVILVINAAFSLFWHLVKGEIRQYIPRPYGFFDQAIQQTIYYVRGIMTGAPHPFEKTKQQKLNPLQQVTYFGLLNVLLPLQILTGTLMWGVQGLPEVAGALGGLPLLAPLHTLVAWLLATFVVAHVYLTTTAGVTATTDIKAMITGWEDVEIHQQQPATGD